MAKKEEQKKKSNKIRPYPHIAIEKALEIAYAIKEKNGGKPWPPAEVASATDNTPRSAGFFYQTSAAQAFGLTKGTRDAAQIALEPLGQDVVYASSPQEELRKKQEAFFNIEIFKKVFDHYKDTKLPEKRYLSNTLENEYKLDPIHHEEFVKIFKENTKYLELESEQGILRISENKNHQADEKNSDSETIVVSEAQGGASEVFVIMPFSEKTEKYKKGFFKEVLSSLITPAATEAEFTVRTARRTGSDVIQSTIINALLSADLVIADLTEHNPNVLFELGVRMALEKPVLLIRAEGTEKIFDVDNMLRVFDYKPMLWPSTLEDDVPNLTKHIKAAWDTRDEKNYMQILKAGSSK